MTRCRDVVIGSMVRRLWGGSELRRGSDSPQEEWGNVCEEMSSPSPPEGGQDSSGQALGTGYGLAAPKHSQAVTVKRKHFRKSEGV